MLKAFHVTEAAKRPNSKDETCFYCRQPIGKLHKDNCVLVRKQVHIRAVIELRTDVPWSWNKVCIEDGLNQSSWPIDGMLDELKKLADSEGFECEVTCVDARGEPYLKEMS